MDAGHTWAHMGLDGDSPHRPRGHPPLRSRTSSTSPRWAIFGDLIKSAACSKPPTAAPPGRNRSSSMRTPASPTSPSIHKARTRFTPRPTNDAAPYSAITAEGRAAGSTKPWTAALTGPGSPKASGHRRHRPLRAWMLSRKNPNIVYALMENMKEGGIFRSEDKGIYLDAHERHQSPAVLLQPGSHRSQQRPEDLGARRASLTTAKTEAGLSVPDRWRLIHSDFHALWIDPANSDHMVLGFDGGITMTYDGGRSWDYCQQRSDRPVLRNRL